MQGQCGHINFNTKNIYSVGKRYVFQADTFQMCTLYFHYLLCRHVGDLGNVVESSGTVIQTITDTTISLESSSNNYIVGRAAVVSIHNKCMKW